MDRAKSFYDREYQRDQYAPSSGVEEHSYFSNLREFIDTYRLAEKKCLEVGCGRGIFQDMVSDYTGVDLSDSVRSYFHKPFFQGSATNLPFGENTFDAIWSITVLEHVPDPASALLEMCRVVKPHGVIFLAPAWQCRSWARDGYPVRPYGDFNTIGKIIKASIIIRNSTIYRSAYIFPRRIARLFSYLMGRRPLDLRYRKLNPNYDKYWMSDSDACCSIDPFEAILWFLSRGHLCPTYGSLLKIFFVRTGPIIFRIEK